MKAVIVDRHRGQAAALGEDGRVIRLRGVGYEIGQTVDLYEARRATRPGWRKTAAAAVAAAFVLCAGTGTAYAMPYGTVSLDVNPSIEYTINCFDYVLDVQGANADGEALLEGLNRGGLVHCKIDAALSATVEQLEAEGYLDAADAALTIAAGTRSEKHSSRLGARLERLLDEEAELTVPVRVINGGMEESARENADRPQSGADSGEASAMRPEAVTEPSPYIDPIPAPPDETPPDMDTAPPLEAEPGEAPTDFGSPAGDGLGGPPPQF